MTLMCNIPSSLEVYNVTWTKNDTAISSDEESFEVVEYNLLKIRDMDVLWNEYRCMVYKNSSDELPTISPSLVVFNYSKLFL